jgi:hypothetical protein
VGARARQLLPGHHVPPPDARKRLVLFAVIALWRLEALSI